MFEWSEWADFWDRHQDRFADGVIALVLVGVLLAIANLVLRRLVGRLVRTVVTRAESSRRRDPAIVRRRADTMAATIAWVVQIFLLFLGLSLVLSEFGFNVTAVAAGLGIAGIGIGLGTQSLVRDVVNGMFILIEDQFGVGDTVQLTMTNGQSVAGVVEDLNPRRTVLRNTTGDVHVVPNSAILVATNMTQDFSRIQLDVAVAYKEDLDRVTAVIDEECAALAKDYPGDILTPPSVLRVESVASTGVTIRVTGDVKVGRQWELTAELRRRLKARFDAEGIGIP